MGELLTEQFIVLVIFFVKAGIILLGLVAVGWVAFTGYALLDELK